MVKYKVMTIFFPEWFSIPNNGNIISNEIIVIKKPIVTFKRLSNNDCFLVCIAQKLNF